MLCFFVLLDKMIKNLATMGSLSNCAGKEFSLFLPSVHLDCFWLIVVFWTQSDFDWFFIKIALIPGFRMYQSTQKVISHIFSCRQVALLLALIWENVKFWGSLNVIYLFSATSSHFATLTATIISLMWYLAWWGGYGFYLTDGAGSWLRWCTNILQWKEV